MSLPSRLFALRPIAAALASAFALVLVTSQPAHAQVQSPTTDTQKLMEEARRAPRNDLLQIYREALANDATYAAARYQQQAAQERVPQARSGLLPNVGLTGQANLNNYQSTEPDIGNNFNVYGGGVNLTVPVYRPQNWEALEQAKISVMTADLTLQQSTQDLALRVATAYFNVLAARDQLIALEAAKKATLEQLQQAKREFEVGTKTIIDTNEAQARYDQIVAQEQVALGTLLVRRSELQTIIGRDLGTLAPLRDRPNLTPPQPSDIAQWVRSAEDTSYTVQIARANYEIASREVQRQRDAYKPTVDVVGGYNVNKFNGTQSSEFVNPRINTGTVGLQLNRSDLPGRTGAEPGARSAVAARPLERRSRIGPPQFGQRCPRRLHRSELWSRAGARAGVRRGFGPHAARFNAARLPGRRADSARRAERDHAAGADAARREARPL